MVGCCKFKQHKQLLHLHLGAPHLSVYGKKNKVSALIIHSVCAHNHVTVVKVNSFQTRLVDITETD